MAFVVKEHIQLAPYTYMKIGGPARFFIEAHTSDEIREALQWAAEHDVSYVVLGAGSNILVSDKGFDGLVIRTCGAEYYFYGDSVYADAGVSMAQLASASLQQNLSGFEWAAGIPGTIGGSVYGNAGCFGGEMKQVLECVRVLKCKMQSLPAGRQGEKYKVVEFQNTDCGFDYRESIFKKQKNLIILGATLKLKRVSDAEKKEKQTWLQNMARERVAEQAIGERTMGSTFKGIRLTEKLLRTLQSYDARFRKAERACWVFENRAGVVSAGFFIERAGLKGTCIGGVSVSQKHANFFVNNGTATAEHVITLIACVKERVHRMFGIMLEEEIQYIGFTKN